MSDQYNGWTNRETWAVWVDLSNDEENWSLAQSFGDEASRHLKRLYPGFPNCNWQKIADALKGDDNA